MQKADRARQARDLLDRRFRQQTVSALRAVPRRGWIRAVREALGMSTRDLAALSGANYSAVTQWEQSEANDRIQLGTLRRAADALGCDLIYALVPRTTLDDTVRQQARRVAKEDVAEISQMMRLEDQELPESELERRVDAYADELIASGRLWAREQMRA